MLIAENGGIAAIVLVAPTLLTVSIPAKQGTRRARVRLDFTALSDENGQISGRAEFEISYNSTTPTGRAIAQWLRAAIADRHPPSLAHLTINAGIPWLTSQIMSEFARTADPTWATPRYIS